jgi:hypothetical protein
LEESSTFPVDQQRITLAPSESELGAAFLLNGEHNQPWDADVMQTDHTEEVLRFHSPESFGSIFQYDFGLFFPTEPREDGLSTLVSVPSASALPSFTNSQIRPSLCPRLPTPVPNSFIASPHATPINADFGYLSDGYQTSLRQGFEPVSLSDKIIFHGTNSESILPSVLMMRKLFHHLQADEFRNQHISLRGMSTRELHDEIKSEGFLSKINEIVQWAYEASAKMIQREIAAPQSSYIGIQPFSQSCEQYSEDMSQTQAQSVSNMDNSAILKGTSIGYCNIRTQCTTGGRLQIHLRQVPKGGSGRDEDDSRNTITVSVIPEIRSCAETGIHVTLPTIPRGCQGLPMYTSIRTFSVIPGNSEIISCVKLNDLEGVRRLISERKASPQDVDPDGLSLLYVGLRPFRARFQLS